jgi:hypothetical protein
MVCGRTLDRCIFCEGHPTTEEHVVADWVLRAFARTKKPQFGLAGTMVAPGQMRLEAAEPISTARVVCQPCNNGWMSRIDNAAARVLRPLVQGKAVVDLASGAQRAVAGWIFKSALTFDALQSGNEGPLGGLRGDFAASHRAPPGCTVYLGPAPPVPFSLATVPEAAGLVMFGVRPTEGRMNVRSQIHTPDGKLARVGSSNLAIPGYLVMLGRVQAIISGVRAPLVPTSGQGFVRIWPTANEPVTVVLAPPWGARQEQSSSSQAATT